MAALDTAIMEVTEDQGESTQAYSALEEQLEMLQSNLKDIEDEQISVSERLAQIEKDDLNAVSYTHLDVYKRQRLHLSQTTSSTPTFRLVLS